MKFDGLVKSRKRTKKLWLNMPNRLIVDSEANRGCVFMSDDYCPTFYEFIKFNKNFFVQKYGLKIHDDFIQN